MRLCSVPTRTRCTHPPILFLSSMGFMSSAGASFSAPRGAGAAGCCRGCRGCGTTWCCEMASTGAAYCGSCLGLPDGGVAALPSGRCGPGGRWITGGASLGTLGALTRGCGRCTSGGDRAVWAACCGELVTTGMGMTEMGAARGGGGRGTGPGGEMGTSSSLRGSSGERALLARGTLALPAFFCSCSLSRQSFSCFSFSSERETLRVSNGTSLTIPGRSLQPARGKILKLKHPGFHTILSKSQLNGHCTDTNTSGHLFTAVDFNQALKLGFDVCMFLYVFRTPDKVNEICVAGLAK